MPRSNLKLVNENNSNVKPSRKPKLRIDQLEHIDPLTENQLKFFKAYDQKHTNIALHGVAGTGKTYVALYKALEEVLDKKTPDVEHFRPYLEEARQSFLAKQA